MESTPVPLRFAYLLSQYPAVNHVFMLREIRFLRRIGFDIHTFSVSDADRPLAAMTEVEREEVLATEYVKNVGILRLIGSQISTFFSRPISYCRGLSCALGFGMWPPRKMVYGIYYFAEAVVVGHTMMRSGRFHLHTHFASTVALIIVRTFPVTMSVTFHGPMEFDNVEAFRLQEKIRYSLFSCAISRYGLSQLMRVVDYPQWQKLEWTPLGVDPEEFAPRSSRPNPSPFQILCVGRLAPVKGQHVLIAAVGALVSEGHDILVLCVGDGPNRAELMREVDDRGLSQNVVFVGNVNQDALRALYRECDALALSSFSEGLPVVLMEAMAMEIPCIATWVAGVPELIRDGVDGLLVPPTDEAALARAILRLREDPDLCLRLGREARRRVVAEYNVNRNCEHLAGVFRRRLELGRSDSTNRPTAPSRELVATDDLPFRHYSTKHRIVAWISQHLFDNVTYTVRHGLIKGMKRKGGLAWLPEFLSGPTRTPEQSFWMHLNLKDLVIYDIGAFQGLLTLFFARQGQRVISYEPNTQNYERLMENLSLNGLSNVLVRKVGIGSKAEVATMVASPLMTGGASIATDTVAGLLRANKPVVSEQVAITSLDEEILQMSLPIPDFIKIDIEGGELAALVGARHILTAHRPRLFLEMHGETMNLKRTNVAAIVSCLNELGYRDIRHIESGVSIEPGNSSIAAEGHLYCS